MYAFKWSDDEEFVEKKLGTHTSRRNNSGSYGIGIRLGGSRVRLRIDIHPDYIPTIKSFIPRLPDLR